jgi:hypothetical protein
MSFFIKWYCFGSKNTKKVFSSWYLVLGKENPSLKNLANFAKKLGALCGKKKT